MSIQALSLEMDEPFLITVNYKGVERDFEANLRVFGYTHKFHVAVDGTEVLFERDEEGNYRAIIPAEHTGKIPDAGLLQHIAHAIERILA
jgi:hypothetical protein